MPANDLCMMPAPVHNLSIRSSVRQLPLVREYLGQVAHMVPHAVSPGGIWRASVALVEAVTNAIQHAHPQHPEHPIHIAVRMADRVVRMQVSDLGPAYRLPPLKPPTLQQTRGRGLFLIRRLCRRVQLRRVRGRNILLMMYEDAAPEVFPQQALAAVHRMSAAIIEAPRLDAVCEQMLDEVVRVIPVSKASILRYDPDTHCLHIVAARGVPRAILRRVAIQPGEGISGRVMASGQPLLVKDIDQMTGLVRRRRYRGRSLISTPVATMPLRVDGRPLGVINMTDKLDGTDFTDQDLQLLSTLANQAAAAMHLCALGEAVAHSRQLDHELALARTMQQALLPRAHQRLPGMEVAGYCRASARVGGDYYDYFHERGADPGVVVADVAGHNVAAALMMAGFRGYLRTVMGASAQSLGQVLREANRYFYRDLVRVEQFVSCVLVRYRPATRGLQIAVAGHPPPLWYERRRQRVRVLPAGGGLIGVEREANFPEHGVTVASQDVCLLYTDGLIGMRNARGVAWGIARLRRCFSRCARRSPPEIVATIARVLGAFAGKRAPDDDVTLVVIKFK